MGFKIKPLFDDVILPSYATAKSAGMDLRIHNFKMLFNSSNEDNLLNDLNPTEIPTLSLPPGARVLIGTGFAVSLPDGFEMQIRPRSGAALKLGLTVLNSPGTIDADYRLEVGVILINNSKEDIVLFKGDRVAQAVIAKFEHVRWDRVTELDETERKGGFGSTGKQ